MKSIIIDIGMFQSKLGIIQDKKLIDLYVENHFKENNTEIVGNIYRGKVENVLVGMQAAFIDIGGNKNGYLQLLKGEKIKKGQEVLVQVKKEIIGDKGAKLSKEISIPGKYMVLIPFGSKICVSNKINDEKEVKRIRKIISKIIPKETGIIVRTEGAGRSEDDFLKDLNELRKIYENLHTESLIGSGPKLLLENLDTISKVVKDKINNEIEEIIINNYEKFLQIREMVKKINPILLKKIKYHEDQADIFEYYGLETQYKRAQNRKVWLKSGGYLIIDKAEALTVIDVNSGKYAGKYDIEETAYHINTEAATEIAIQLKLRDIGGIIIVDFIDMQKTEHKKSILDKLKHEFGFDKTKTKVLGITNLGLVEIVRRKQKESIEVLLKQTCHSCKGEGLIKSYFSTLNEIEKEVIRIKNHTNSQNISIRVSENFFNYESENNFAYIRKIESKHNCKLQLEIS